MAKQRWIGEIWFLSFEQQIIDREATLLLLRHLASGQPKSQSTQDFQPRKTEVNILKNVIDWRMKVQKCQNVSIEVKSAIGFIGQM